MIRLSHLVACIALIAGFCSGCSTVKSLSSDDPTTPKIYGGVRLHLKDQSEADAQKNKLGGQIVSAIFDLPFSAILDTLLLPVTVFLEPDSPEAIRRENEREKARRKNERKQGRDRQDEADEERSAGVPATSPPSSLVQPLDVPQLTRSRASRIRRDFRA